MEKIHDSVWSMWDHFLRDFPEHSGKSYESWFFGDSASMALELAELVMKGEKTASCGALWEYEKDGDRIPQKGDLSVITDFYGKALCIIQTKQISIKKFNEVDAEFARKEGEGDLSYAYWYEAHTNFFKRTDSKENPQFSEDMLLVCEEFEVVFPIKFTP